jgi:hypothetical protein
VNIILVIISDQKNGITQIEVNMDVDEVRAKAAELSMMFSAHVTAALVMRGGIGEKDGITELSPLALAPQIEEYIRTGKLPEPIPVTKVERKVK